MIFASDNWAGVHQAIAASLTKAATGFSSAYGSSDLDRAVGETFSRVFEREAHVFFVGTGTAANALSMALFAKPGGVCFVHREAHMAVDECGAPEFLSGGSRLCLVDGPLGRMTPVTLDAAIGKYPAEFVHSGRPSAVSITQSTEIGTVYRLEDIDALAVIASNHSLPLHMDGARFANALVSLGCSPAEMTWKRGVDAISFGGTKNGCWCAEAVVLFDADLAKEFAFIRKRAAQLFSKSRFMAAQFAAYFEGDLWLDSAHHANAMAQKLAETIRASKDVRLAWEPQANEVFAIIGKSKAETLKEAGAMFYPWEKPAGSGVTLDGDEHLFRFVTSFATTTEDIDRLAVAVSS